MKIWTLMENTASREDLAAEHGLSLYIEAKGKRILFDAGQTAAFAENAQCLGIDLGKVDLAVLSHGHYDHSGGLLRFLECNERAPVYVSSLAAGDYYNAQDRYIGIAPELKENPRLISVGEKLELAEGITLVSCQDRRPVIDVDSAGLQKKTEGRLQPDAFLHEQYLIIEEKGKRVVFSGCSHRGIRNIVKWLPCDILIGGFHFMKKDPHSPEVMETAEQLLREDTVYYTCHCTGRQQYESMKAVMGSRLQYLAAGDCLEVGET